MFGNPNYYLSDGEVTLISAVFLLVAAVIMWLVAVRQSGPGPGRGDPGERERRGEGRAVRQPDGIPGVSSAAPAGQLRAEDVSFAYVGAARAALRHVNLGVAPGAARSC